MVIGGTKPIHVPKTDPLPTPAERPNRASGIFRRGGGGSTDGGDSKNSQSRGRGGSPSSSSNRGTTPTASGATGNGRTSVLLDNDEDSPQKILLSLRTPTSSFEEKKESDGVGGGPKTTGLTLSPDDDDDAPLMSTTQQRAVELFEVCSSYILIPFRELAYACVCPFLSFVFLNYFTFLLHYSELRNKTEILLRLTIIHPLSFSIRRLIVLVGITLTLKRHCKQTRLVAWFERAVLSRTTMQVRKFYRAVFRMATFQQRKCWLRPRRVN
jgi:hypothetical protein